MKLAIKLGLVFFISWILYLIPIKFFPLDCFKIKSIEIRGNTKNLSSELTELTNRLYNNNIWEIDFRKLEKFLEQDVRIKEVKIVPISLGKVVIYIDEKETSYYAQINKNLYAIDSEGEVIRYFKENNEFESYFLMCKNEEELPILVKIAEKIDNYNLKNLISQIYIVDPNCINIVLDDGTLIKTNNEVEDEKYDIVEYLYQNVKQSKRIEYIDMRFNDFIIKSLGEKKDGK